MVNEGFVISLINIISKSTLPFTIISALLLFMPEEYLTKMNLIKFRNDYLMWISLLLIVCLGFHISSFIQSIYRFIKAKIKMRMLKRKLIKNINELTQEEINILGDYITNETQTQYLSIEDGVIKGLERKGYIIRVASIGDALNSQFAYNIQPFIYKHLRKLWK